MKKCIKVIKWVMTLCLLLFLSGCSEKNIMPAEESVSEQKEQISDAMPVEEPVSEQKEHISDAMLMEEPIKEQKTQASGTLSTYKSEGEMYAAQTKRLAQKLVLEGQIKDEHDLIFVDACQRDIPYNYKYFHDYAHKDESALDVHYPYELYHVSLSEDGEITYYYTLLDYCVSTLDSGENMILAGNEQDEVIREVTDLSTALKQETPFKYNSSNLSPYVKIYKSGVDLIRVLKNQWSTEQLVRLQDPVTAAETLLLLRGGKGERLENGNVKYQFANGEEITYDMTFDGEYWMPTSCWEKDDELYPELKGITDDQERYEMISSLAVKSITMEDIKNAVYCKNADNSPCGMLQEEMTGEGFCIFRCGNAQLFTDWEKYYLIDDGDASRSVNTIVDTHLGNYEKGCFDYDGDGQKEYAFVIQVLGGTGVLCEDLYIFDIENDHLNVRSFNYLDMSVEPIESILPEGCFAGGSHVKYELKKGQIILEYGVAFETRRFPEDMGFLRAKFMYHDDGSYELTEPQFEMYDDLRTSVEKEKVLLQYSASELRKVKRYYEGESVQKTETPNYEVVIIAEDSKADAAMYGISDERRDVTVLRVKDDVYRLYLNDWSLDNDNQRVFGGYDYDKDGQMEYLYYEVDMEGKCEYVCMFDITDDGVNLHPCYHYFDDNELQTLLGEKYDQEDRCRNISYVISPKNHSILCVGTVFGYASNKFGYDSNKYMYEKAQIQCDVKYGTDGNFSFENPVITMLAEE